MTNAAVEKIKTTLDERKGVDGLRGILIRNGEVRIGLNGATQEDADEITSHVLRKHRDFEFTHDQEEAPGRFVLTFARAE